MKRAIILLLLISIAQLASASKIYFYSGYVLTTENEKMDYEIKFTLKDDNKIIGYSITAKGTINEMKARLIGKYNPKNKFFYLKETRVLTAKREMMTYCYFVVKAKLVEDKKARFLKGTFIGYEEDRNTFCTKGRVFLRGSIKQVKKKAPIVAKPKSTPKPKVSPKPKATPKPKLVTKPKANPTQPKTTVKKRTVKRDTLRSDLAKKKQIEYEWDSDKLTVQFWDDSKLDGDALNFFINGRPIFRNHVLKGEKKIVSLPLNSGIYTLKIQAVNEGEKPPNTARVVLVDGLKNYDLITHIRKGQEVIIRLRKK